MSSIDAFLHTPESAELFNLAKRCSAIHSIGVLTGNNGSGKTFCLKHLQVNPVKCGLEGQIAYFLAATAAGPTRGLKDFLVDRGVKQVVYQKGLSTKLLCKLAHREFQEHNVRTLLVDEADVLDIQALQGFVSLADTCRDMDFPIAILFAGVSEPSQWLGQIGAADSRTLHFLKLTDLTPELVVAVFAGWGAPLSGLSDRVKAGDKDATALVRTIHRGTGGNFRKLSFFAKLAALEHPDGVTSVAVVDEIFAKMTRQA
jgi:hypothetical protein